MRIIRHELKGEALPDYRRFAEPILGGIVANAGLTHPSCDWAVIVHNCHPYVGRIPRPRHDTVKIGANNPVTGHIKMKISPAEGDFSFELILVTAKKDNWAHTIRLITSAAQQLMLESQQKPPATFLPPDLQPEPGESPPMPADIAAKPLVDSIDQLVGLRDNLNSVIGMAADAKAAGEMRKEIQARYDAVKAEAAPLIEARYVNDHNFQTMRQVRVACEARVAGAEEALAAAKRNLEKSQEQERELREELRRASEAAEDPEARLKAVEAELHHADELEAERAKSVREAPGIAVLLAALGQFNQPKQ